MMIRLVPNVFYEHLADGLDLFVGCLGFRTVHQEPAFAIVQRDGAKVYLVESAEFAARDRPQITIETDTIGELYTEISSRRPEMLHPNASVIQKKPWGSLEFGVLDKTQVCVIFRQFAEAKAP
jgi:hypothetical protein